MKYLLWKPLRLVVCVLALAISCRAEKGILVIQVSDIHNQPVESVELATKGSSESGVTDRFGRTRIKLDFQIKLNDWIALQIVKSPKEKDLVFISPWDAHAQVPPFDNETVNFLPLVVASRGDRALLESGKALTAIVAQINKANSPKSKDPEPEQQRQEALATIAKSFGLVPNDVDKAIRAWGERASDPYEKGLAALYERNYPLASRELSKSLEMREKELAQAQATTADAAFFLGESKYEEGKYRDSVVAYKKALALRADDTTLMTDLALSLQSLGDYAAAGPLYVRALLSDEKMLGQNHPNVARDLMYYGQWLSATGDYRGAEPLYRRSLALAEETFGPDHRNVGICLNNLAELLENKGDYAGAEELYRRTLAIYEKVLEPNDPSIGTVLSNLGLLSKYKGNYAEGEQLIRRALAIDEKALGSEHPYVGAILSALAVILQAKGDSSGAKLLCRRALAIDEKTLGPDHPSVARDLNNLGMLLAKNDYAEGERLIRRALAIDEKAQGPVHPILATRLNNLAFLLASKGDYVRAEPLYRRALAIAEKALGPDHPDVGTDLNNLGELLKAKGDYAGAEPLLRRALAIDEKALGPDHLTTQTVRGNLAALIEQRSKTGQPK